MERIVIDNKINCLYSFCNDMKKIVIYCHGFGESKERINQHYDLLNINSIGIISFDLPCHGDDETKFRDITYKLCLDYINSVVQYIEKNYKNIPISFIGSSFGGYLVLSYLNDYNKKFDKIFLKYPAVNFYECVKRKLNIDDTYFSKNDYFELPSGYKLYKKFYDDVKKHDIMNKFEKSNNDIYIIHGNKDTTVLIEDVIKFANENNIKLKIIPNAKHGMKDYLDLVNDEIINYFVGNIRIFNIKDKPEYIKEVAILTQNEWGKIKEKQDGFEQKINIKIRQIKDGLNLKDYCKLILLDNEKLVGFISIFPKDGEEYSNLNPWYATMYVKKEYRKLGYSKILNNAILIEAKIRGFDKIYLKSELKNYYEKFGAIYLDDLKNGEKLYYIKL